MYGITAVRLDASGAPRIDEVLMGRLTEDGAAWHKLPAPVPLVDVIDRLLEGDAIVAIREEAGGVFRRSSRAELQVQDSLHGGWDESIAFSEDDQQTDAPSLRNLPRF